MIIEAIIEIPMLSSFKYEIKEGKLLIDRVLNDAFPENYGFIDNTLSEDGDPLDVFVLSTYPIYPKTYVKGNLIGVIKCLDNGLRDDKLIINFDANPNNIKADIFNIIDYLQTYKPGFEVIGYGELEEAKHILEKAIELDDMKEKYV